jgi:hypothetical protein
MMVIGNSAGDLRVGRRNRNLAPGVFHAGMRILSENLRDDSRGGNAAVPQPKPTPNSNDH